MSAEDNDRHLRVTIGSLIQSKELVTISVDTDEGIKQLTGYFKVLSRAVAFYTVGAENSESYMPNDIRSIWVGRPGDTVGDFVQRRENPTSNMTGLHIATVPISHNATPTVV